jgi:lambda repressor-like predicted transcriptional regulator
MEQKKQKWARKPVLAGFLNRGCSMLANSQSVEAKFLSSHISPTTNSATLFSNISAQCQPTQLSTYKLQPVLMLRPCLYRSFVTNSKPSIDSKFALEDNTEPKHIA